MSDQSQLEINDESKLSSVETYKFEPIKGYPILNWKGKRPFSSTQYYPAQLKENHGEPADGWMNRIYWGDNLQVMSHLLKEFRGKVDLVYIDPPFDSKADYKKKIKLLGKQADGDHSAFEEKQYSDIWTSDGYLQFLYERLILMRELLSSKGSIFLHCDDAKNHLIRALLDEVFSADNFVNEIVWKRSTSSGLASKRCNTLHDTIYWYSKTKDYVYNVQYHEYEEAYLKRAKKDEDGREYIPIPTGNPGPRPNLYYAYKGYLPHPNGYKWTKEKMEKFDKEGRLLFPANADGRIQYKQYLDEMEGVKLQDIWLDIPAVNPVAQERNGYPTQKPEALLQRIIRMASNPGALVFDCFMGSGTTPVVAAKEKRRFLGADINLAALQIATKRLLPLTLNKSSPTHSNQLLNLEEDSGASSNGGFSFFNVNNYDFFRNPLEARELLLESLEIQPLPAGSLYDGEKDGRMVKILPVNRIATKADLTPLITGFDYKGFQKRQEVSPNKAVESLLLICMGHEPDLAAHLKRECPFDLDVEVVDILRDKSNIHFKREAEAEILVEEGKLKIFAFYPMNLLQKLSMQKERVEDWRELTESVMIDWNYDGAVFEPSVVDVPEKNKLVVGEYDVPKDAGTIRVKITDLLSESLEMEVAHGKN